MKRYHGVHGRARVSKISLAIERSGSTILTTPNPREAPFEYRIRTPAGETLDLVCYAFTANKYRQRGRPADEHRFQVKYGSDFRRAHELFIDPARASVTLMFGVHDQLPLFVSVDPAMHTPTWFSSSVEFKDRDLRRAKQMGWHGWERDRVALGRRRVLPREDLRTEVLIAFRPQHFLTYVLFERIATGMDPGERLLLADRLGELIEQETSPSNLLQWLPDRVKPAEFAKHPLLLQLGLEPAELLEVIGGSFRLLAAVRGSVAEHHLGCLLRTVPGVNHVVRVDENGKPDFNIEYGRRTLRIECKNVLRRLAGNVPRVDFQKTRASKSNPCSRYYEPRQFEILAACLHPVTERWEFRFCATDALSPHPNCPGRISEHVRVSGSEWMTELPPLLERLTR
jgi:hypothetical protein